MLSIKSIDTKISQIKNKAEKLGKLETNKVQNALNKAESLKTEALIAATNAFNDKLSSVTKQFNEINKLLGNKLNSILNFSSSFSPKLDNLGTSIGSKLGLGIRNIGFKNYALKKTTQSLSNPLSKVNNLLSDINSLMDLAKNCGMDTDLSFLKQIQNQLNITTLIKENLPTIEKEIKKEKDQTEDELDELIDEIEELYNDEDED